MLAARDLKAGDLVLKERPILTLEDNNTSTTWAKLETAYNGLSDDDRKLVDTLCVADIHADLPKYQAIFKTNAMQLGAGRNVGGLFIDGSRFNHACSPNCSRAWDSELGVEWFIAMEDVKAGTELTISYGEVRTGMGLRQLALQQAFDFSCRCRSCCHSLVGCIDSDRRRAYIKQLVDSTTRLQMTNPLLLIRNANIALNVMRQERLYQGRADLAFECFSTCCWYGDFDNAQRWIDKTLELDRVESGVWSTKYQKVLSYTENPRIHPGWNLVATLMGWAREFSRVPSEVESC